MFLIFFHTITYYSYMIIFIVMMSTRINIVADKWIHLISIYHGLEIFHQ